MYGPLRIIFSSLFVVGTLFLLLSVKLSSAEETYNVGAFLVDPNSAKEVLQQSTGFPLSHSDYIVQNIGKTPIWVEIKYGTLVMWHGTVVSGTVNPGEKKYFSNTGKYYVTALKLKNDSATKARVVVSVVYGSFTSSLREQPDTSSNFDINEFAKFYYATVTDNIPVVGATISHLIEYFWPDTEEEDVWDQVKDHVADMIDSKISDTIENLLDSNLRSLKKKVRSLDRSIKKGITGSNITDHYMNVAQDFIGIEEAFRFKKINNMDVNKMNYVALPLFSMTITMKLMFYRLGIQNKEQLGLNDAKISQLQLYSEEMLDDGVFTHISKVYEERMAHEYWNSAPGDLFNALATVTTFTAINGFENIPMWEQWIRQPFSNYTPYCDTVTISTPYGNVTTDLLMQATGGQIGRPLIPPIIEKQIHGKPFEVREHLHSLAIEHDHYLVKAVTTYYESIIFHMGSAGEQKDVIDLKKKYVKKIVAHGKTIIIGLSITLSDGTTKHYGFTQMDYNKTFELDGHHICGIFVGSNKQRDLIVIANMVVSYMKDHEYDFM